MTHKYKIKLFIRFLKENKAYNKFMRNALSLNGFEYRKRYCEGRTLNEHINYELKYNNGKNIIDCSFQWDKTDEGADFWYDIYLKWEFISK
jgi:hypothetical protein